MGARGAVESLETTLLPVGAEVEQLNDSVQQGDGSEDADHDEDDHNLVLQPRVHVDRHALHQWRSMRQYGRIRSSTAVKVK